MDLGKFLANYFAGAAPGEMLHTRSFDRETGQVDQRWFETGDGVAAYVATLDDQTWDVYFGVSSRRPNGAAKADVRRLYALWADLDFKHFRNDEEALVVLNGFELPPSYVITSGGGYQVYWLLADPLDADPATVAHAESLMLRLYQRLGGLDRVQDVSRIMRVPGTRNQKYKEKPLVELVEAHGKRRYTLAQFEAVLPMLDDDGVEKLPGVETTYTIPKEQEVREMLAVLPPQGWDYRDYLAILMAVHSIFPDQRGVRLIQGWSPALDQDGQDSTAKKFASFRNRGVSMGTLVKFAQEHGWQPKRGPKIRLVRSGLRQPAAPTVKKDAWELLLEGYPPLDWDELPLYLAQALDYAEPFMQPFSEDWSEMLFLSFFSSQFSRIRFENLNSALWFLGIAPQGVGKSVGVDEWQRVFTDITTVRELDMPVFTSGTTRGLGNMMAGDGRTALAIFDEYSAFAKAMNNDFSSNIKELMNQLYDGRGFSHRKADEAITGTDPFLVSIGITTPPAFRATVKADDMQDGYMSRMLFAAPTPQYRLPDRPTATRRAAITDTLLELVQRHAHLTTARFDTLVGQNPRVLTEYMRDRGINSGRRLGLEQELGKEDNFPWGRVIVRIKKIAMLLELLEEYPQVDDNALVVHERNVALAIRLAHRGAAYHHRALGLMQYTKNEAALEKVIAALADQQFSTVREIQQRRHIESAEIKQALAVLEEDGRVASRAEGKRREYFLIRREAA